MVNFLLIILLFLFILTFILVLLKLVLEFFDIYNGKEFMALFKQGTWKEWSNDYFECSSCHEKTHEKTVYCPNCGKKMNC